MSPFENIKPNRLKPRWSKVVSDLWGDKTRTALVVASIAVGVFAIGVILSAFNILGQDINLSYGNTNPSNIELWTAPFYNDLIRVVEKMPGVDQVEGRQTISVRARRGNENWQGVLLFGVPDFENSTINQIDTIEGATNLGENEIFFSEDLMTSSGFQVGDEIEIELPDGSIHPLTVVGLVSDQQSIRPDTRGVVTAFVTMETLRGFGLGSYFNRFLITVDGNGGDEDLIATVTADVEDKLESHNLNVFRTREALSNAHPMIDLILALLGLLGALGILVTILSASLIINTLNALLTQQLRQIGIMKLIGARSRQILGMYLGLIVSYSVVALMIAVPLSAIAGYRLAQFISDMMGAVLQGFRIVPMAILAQIMVAFLIPLGAGFFPVNQGAKTKVRRAISNFRPGESAARQGLLSRSGAWVRWISRPILLSFRNTFRKKGRLILTIFTLSVAGGVFIGVFNVRTSMSNAMDKLMQHFLGDVTVTLSEPYNVRKVERDLLAVPGVQSVEGWGGANADILDQNGDVVTSMSIIAPPEQTRLLEPKMVDGRWLQPGEKKAMAISDTIYDFYPDLRAGDTLMVKVAGTTEEPWEVVGVYEFVSMLGDPMAYANFDYVAEKINLPNQAASYRISTNETGDTAISALIQHIDRQLENKGYAVQGILSGDEMRESSGTAVNILIVFLLAMALLTAFVGSIGLMGTMSINVLERTREIGVMRTIGAVDLVVMQSVIIEGLVIGLITWLIAIGLSYPISKALLDIISQTMTGSSFDLIFTPLGVYVWLGVVIMLSIVASVMPARNAARLTINEVLAYE